MYKVFLFVFSCLIIFSGCKHKDTKDAEKYSGEEMPVAVATPEVMNVTLTQSFPGNLQAIQEVDIMARANGVLKVHVPSGSKVIKGQLLYTIENTKYEDDVKQAEASIATAQASLATAEANYAYYQKQYAAMQKAFKSDAVSEMEVLQSENNMKQSQASIDNAKATIENARAALDEAKIMLGYCRITAPFSGTLGLQEYDQDAYINGQTSPVKLNTLYNDATVYAYISIDEAKFAEMMNNIKTENLNLDSVKINFNSPLAHQYYSKINFSAPDVSTSTGTVTLRFGINNKYGELKSGMYMNVELPYQKNSDALLVKDASIGTDQLGKYLYLVNDSNKVVYTPIEVGEIYADTMRIVTKGLTPESRYVTEALLKVRDGMKVKPF